MPPKRKASPKASPKRAAPKSTRQQTASKRKAASKAAATVSGDDDETYDMGSIPMEVELTPQPTRSGTPGGARKGAKGGSGGKQRSSGAASTVTTQPEPSSLLQQVPSSASAAAASGGGNNKDSNDADGSLADMTIEALLRGADVSSTVDGVLSVYRGESRQRALSAVLNVVAKASGVAEVELDEQALAEGVDVGAMLDELYARVPSESAVYLLVSKDAAKKRFRRAFPDFCEKLIQIAFSTDVLLDAEFLETLLHWLLAMSESKVRSFRHTATVMLLGFLRGLNKLLADLKARLSIAKTKKESTDIQKSMKSITTWRDHIFSQSSHLRLRDVAPEIRLAAFQALKEFVLEYPEDFMTNNYLRYFSMPLSDKKPELRMEALDMMLQALARVPDAYTKMHLFLQYSQNRLIELCNDTDVRCAELAIRVIALIARGDSDVAEGRELISNTMMDRALMSLFDERPTIRAAAGILLKVFIHCRTLLEETEAEQLKAAAELLFSFASSLRVHFHEEMPERYLVDALWSDERPPLMLTEYRPLFEVGDTSKEQDVVVLLSLVSALLLRIRNRLTLGPLPKDDRRVAAKRPSAEVRQQTDELYAALCGEAGGLLRPVLEKHRGSAAVLQCVCDVIAAMDVSLLTSRAQGHTLSALIMELRKATSTVAFAAATRDRLVAAWHVLAFTDHPLKTEAQAHLEALLSGALQRLTSGGGASSRGSSLAESVNAWGRFNLLSSLVSVAPHWGVIKKALQENLRHSPAAGNASSSSNSDDSDAALAPVLTDLMASTVMNAALWFVSVAQSDPAAGGPDAVAGQLREVVDLLLSAEEADDGAAVWGDARLTLHVNVLTYLCDVCALQFYTLSQSEQEALLVHFRRVFELLSAGLKTAQEELKVCVAQQSEDFVLSQIARARARCSQCEASQLRVVTGVARLFLFKRLPPQYAPLVLVHWTQTPSKAVADVFKSLFHTLRDRLGDSFPLERDILAQAYTQCAEVGATQIAVDTLYQTGVKLSSMHFLATDRFHGACVSMVQFGAQFAVSTDPLILHGIVPYCSRLRVPEAMAVMRQDLSATNFFVNNANPYVSAFIYALRRAAKLDEAQASSAARVSVKRPREIAVPSNELDEGILAEITESAPVVQGAAAAAAAANRRGGRKSKVSMAERVVTEDGWHVKAGERDATTTLPGAPADAELLDVDAIPQSQETEGARRRGRPRRGAGAGGSSVVNVPTTQETAQSSLGELEGEVFIATEEFD